VGQREKRNALVVDSPDFHRLFERPIRDEMTTFMQAEAGRTAQQHLPKSGRRGFLLRQRRRSEEYEDDD